MSECALTNIFDIDFDSRVAPSTVHKHSEENVFLTECKSYGKGWYVCGARMPTAHLLFNARGRSPQSDILFYTEIGRQASIAISHKFLDVGYDQAFIFQESSASLTDDFWPNSDDANSGSSVVIEVRVKETERRKNGALTRVVAEHSMYSERGLEFRGMGEWTLQSKAMLERFRRSALKTALVAGEMPRDTAVLRPSLTATISRNVVISPVRKGDTFEELSSQLIVDQQHPYFFDHPCDHVPGMLLLEGCAQMGTMAASLSAGRYPEDIVLHGYDVRFLQFVECHQPATFSARTSTFARENKGPLLGTVAIAIEQREVVVGTATIAVGIPCRAQG